MHSEETSREPVAGPASRWPRSTASRHVSALHGQSRARSHCSVAATQGLTLLHFSASRAHFLWDALSAFSDTYVSG